MRSATTQAGRRTRERILAAAIDLVREQGIERTSLDQVLSRTGTSKSQLYHHFGDRDGLVRAIVAREAERVLAETVAALDAVASWASLHAWLHSIVVAQEAEGCRYGCRLGTLAAQLVGDEPREDLAGAFASWESAIAEALDRLRAAGRLRPWADTGALATATLAAIQGGLLLSTTAGDPRPLRTALDAAYAHLRSFAA